MKRLWILVIVNTVVGFLLSLATATMFLMPLGSKGVLWIEKGENTGQIGAKMRQFHLPAYRVNLWLYKMISGKTLKNGEYELEKEWTLWQACTHVASGRVVMHKLTIPEGWTTQQIVEKLRNEPLLAGNISHEPQEGTLLPETYCFARGDTRAQLLQQMEQAMQKWIQQAWDKRNPSVTLTLEEVITLASIVECETPLDKEKATIAGVFYNRLAQNMRLQSDPTVAYSITQGRTQLDKPLTYDDLRISSPFNTYVTPGLPPHPIACPGVASLQAVLHPQKHMYLYFVADGTGGHTFSSTFADHTRNVQKWRQVQAEDKKNKKS